LDEPLLPVDEPLLPSEEPLLPEDVRPDELPDEPVPELLPLADVPPVPELPLLPRLPLPDPEPMLLPEVPMLPLDDEPLPCRPVELLPVPLTLLPRAPDCEPCWPWRSRRQLLNSSENFW
jgi:hypothetical protein